MRVQRMQNNNNYNTNFGNSGQIVGKAKTEEINAISKILNVIQKNMELSDFYTRSEMQSLLHNILIKEGIPNALKQQAKNLLLKSYVY